MNSIYDYLNDEAKDTINDLILDCMYKKNLINPNEEELNFDLLVEFEKPN
jgi:hypothetical protein